VYVFVNFIWYISSANSRKPVVWGKFEKKIKRRANAKQFRAFFFCLSLGGQSSLSDDYVVWANGIFYREQVHREGCWYYVVLNIYLILHIQITDNLRWREFDNVQFYMFTLHTPLTFLVVNILR
jgi:hypothetical protein